jgi:hypothetical protein
MNNTGQIVKAKGGVPFAQIPNELLQNKHLSMKAKGLMSLLLSLPESWVIYKTQLPDFFTDGVDAIRNAWVELESHGYIVSVRVLDPSGKLKGWQHIAYNSPIASGLIDKTPIKTSDPAYIGFSDIGFSDMVKSNAIKKDSTKKEPKNKKERSPIFSFSQFWNVYAQSNGEGKAQANAEWNKLSADDKVLAIHNVSRWAEEWIDKYESYTRFPLAKTYLAGRRWEDEF